jgi:hypothetical protein
MNFKIGTLLAAASTLAVAAPAVAHPDASHHPGGSHAGQSEAVHHAAHANRGNHANGAAALHRCRPHNVAYVEAGTIVGATPSTLQPNVDGTWSGTLVVDVTRANHWAKADKGNTVTYTLTNAKLRVRFSRGVTGFGAGARVTLIGKLAVVSSRCTGTTGATGTGSTGTGSPGTGSPATPVFRAVVVHPAAA